MTIGNANEAGPFGPRMGGKFRGLNIGAGRRGSDRASKLHDVESGMV